MEMSAVGKKRGPRVTRQWGELSSRLRVAGFDDPQNILRGMDLKIRFAHFRLQQGPFVCLPAEKGTLMRHTVELPVIPWSESDAFDFWT